MEDVSLSSTKAGRYFMCRYVYILICITVYSAHPLFSFVLFITLGDFMNLYFKYCVYEHTHCLDHECSCLPLSLKQPYKATSLLDGFALIYCITEFIVLVLHVIHRTAVYLEK